MFSNRWHAGCRAAFRAALRPGARLVAHEYFDYRTWRMMPRCRELESCVALVMESWRGHGGEPDVAIELPSLMRDRGFVVESIRPHVFIVSPEDQLWAWPTAFFHSGLERLVAIGTLSASEAARLREGFERALRWPDVRMVTPALAEIQARAI